MARTDDRMRDFSFKAMTATMTVMDLVHPYVEKRAAAFGIREGMTVVDYGCGPGRYTMQFGRLVGQTGKVYAVDVQPLAVDLVQKKARQQGLANVTAMLAHAYDSGLPDGIADMVCALDMFFSVRDPKAFLGELKRIIRPDGVLIIDDGHQPRSVTKEKIAASGHWQIEEETPDHLKCRPKCQGARGRPAAKGGPFA
jgi:ubiquinone/menaquinone biosynthesis C-methylase UbiE